MAVIGHATFVADVEVGDEAVVRAVVVVRRLVEQVDEVAAGAGVQVAVDDRPAGIAVLRLQRVRLVLGPPMSLTSVMKEAARTGEAATNSMNVAAMAA